MSECDGCCSIWQCNGACANWTFRIDGTVVHGLWLLVAFIDMIISRGEVPYEESDNGMGFLYFLLWVWAFTDAIIQCTIISGIEVQQGFFIGKVVADSLVLGMPVMHGLLSWIADEYFLINFLVFINLCLDVYALSVSCKQPLAQNRPPPAGAQVAVAVGTGTVIGAQAGMIAVVGQPVAQHGVAVGQPVGQPSGQIIGQPPSLPPPVVVASTTPQNKQPSQPSQETNQETNPDFEDNPDFAS